MQLTDFTSSGRRQCIKQEAQLPQRNSASAAHMEEGGPTAHPLRPIWRYICIWSNPKPATNVRQPYRPLSAL